MSGDYILAIDQGTTGTTVLVVDQAGAIVRARNGGRPAGVSPARLGGACSGTALGDGARGNRRGAGSGADRPGRGGSSPRCRGHHEPTRDDDSVGASDRSAGGAGDCLAVPAHGGRLRGAGGGETWPAVPRADRLGARRLLLRYEDRLAAQPGPTAAAARRGRRDRLRHGGHVAGLAADRRPAPRHRRYQRIADAAFQSPQPVVGRRATGGRSTYPRQCCQRCSRPPGCGRGRARLARYRRECLSRALPGTSKRRSSGRHASAPVRPRRPTAPAVSC